MEQAPDLDRESGLAVHVQIERWLVDVIARRDLSPGDRLPAERDLAKRLGVSRMTLRQALDGLQRRGVLERVPGRSGGAFVVEPKIECDLTGSAGFTEQMRRAHRRAGARVRKASTVPADATVADALGVDLGAPVHEIVRVRSANRTPIAFERSFFPAERFPDLVEQRLTGSLYRLLGRAYDSSPSDILEYLEPTVARADEAAELAIAAGTPLILIERTAYSSSIAVEFARDLFRADRVRVMVRSEL